MMNLWTNNLTSILENYWWIGILVVAAIVLTILGVLKSKPKGRTQEAVADEHILDYIQCFGGMQNIQAAELGGRRLKIKCYQIELLDIDRFKLLGATGIFISGSVVKMVLPYNMQKLVDYINDKKLEDKND